MRKPRDLSTPSAPVSLDRLELTPTNGADIEQIRQRAYELYETRTKTNSPGDPMSDWLQAEQQVTSQFARNQVTHAN